MANHLNKDPVVCDEERRSFIVDLHRFHQNRGTQFDLIPKIGGREIDLHRLYRRVVELGGWRKVCNELKWEDLQTEFGIPSACPNGEQALKFIYVRFLFLYEKLNFLGEDPDQKETESDVKHSLRKKSSGPFYGVPLKYNYAQHQIPDLLRKNNGFCLQLIANGDYDKLEKALLSGLPNEVDFAINVCTLLSNEGRHVLRLDKSKHLLHLLLAHIGVFNQGYESLYDLYRHGWTPYTDRDFLRFWYESVNDKAIKELIITNDQIYTQEEKVGTEVLHLGHNMGAHSVEGQRVTQLAVLLRNLSFEDINQKLMASNAVVFKFLMLCVHSTYGTLKQLALDTLGNLAAQMVLDSIGNHRTNLILDYITKSFCADDKFTVVRALEILGKLCQIEQNETYVTETLLSKTYEDVFRLLTVHDIQLIVHTLEALYQLSELGETTTTKIAQVRNAVDVLIDLITVEAQSYGPNSLVGIKVVEYVPAPSARKEGIDESVEHTTSVSNPVSISIPTATPPTTPAKSATPLNTPNKQQPQNTDMEATTLNWFQGTYEARRSGKTMQIELFSEYLQFCHKFSLSNVLSSTEFLHLVKVAFPQSEMKTVTMADGDKDICFLGIGKRHNPKPFLITSVAVPKSMSVSVNLPSGAQASNSSPPAQNTPTPTLRQRLMEPPQHPILQPIVHSGSGGTPVTHKTQSMPTTPRLIAPKPVAKQLQLGSTFVISPAARPPGTTDIASSPSQIATSVKRQKIAPKPLAQTNQLFPSIHNALHGEGNSVVKTAALLLEQESLQKSSDTNLIKSLLAKKLSQNLVGKQNLFVGVTPGQGAQLTESLEQMLSQQQFVSATPVSSDVGSQHPSSIIITTTVYPSSSLPVESHSQPLSSQVPSVSSTLSSTTMEDSTSSLQNIKQKCKSSTVSRPVSPKSQGGQHPTSPRTLSPRSRNLEVCGEVERAKEFVRKGSEAMIETVENKGLQEVESTMSAGITLSSNLCAGDNKSSSFQHNVTSSSNTSISKLPLGNSATHTMPIINSNIENTLRTNGSVSRTSSVSDDVEMIDESHFHSKISDNEQLARNNNSDKISNSVKLNGNPCFTETNLVSDNLSNYNKLKDCLTKPEDCISKNKCNDSNLVNSNTNLVNGNITLPLLADTELPPSPICLNNIQSGLLNGISDDSMDSICGEKTIKSFPKEQITKLIEKSSKINGISRHIGNGDHVENMKVDTPSINSSEKHPMFGNSVCNTSVENHRELNGNIGKSSKTPANFPNMNGQMAQVPVVPKEVRQIIVNTDVCPAIIKIQSSILDDRRICESIRHVPTPETSRDSELSSDSFASSTAESVPEKHSIPITVNVAQAPTTMVLEKLPISGASEKKPKSRKRSRNTASAVTISTECKTMLVPVHVVDFMCEWAGCNRCFENARAVFCHVVKTHTLVGTDGMCKWSMCPPVKRQRWSLITHLQDHHCSDSALRASSARRLQPGQLSQPPPSKKPTPAPPSTSFSTTTAASVTSSTTTSTTTNSSGTLVYPNDAAMQAIKRFLVRPPFQEFLETREGPVTKHIRLTAALILRNIARYSPLGRSLIKKKEPQLSYVTMSAVESSTALASCLWEIMNH